MGTIWWICGYTAIGVLLAIGVAIGINGSAGAVWPTFTPVADSYVQAHPQLRTMERIRRCGQTPRRSSTAMCALMSRASAETSRTQRFAFML